MGRLWLYAGLAAGGLRRQWAGALALAAAATIASAALAAAPAFDGALRDLALREALRAADPAALAVRASGDRLPPGREAYREAQAAADDAVHAALGGAGGAQARSGATAPLDLLAALPRPGDDAPPARIGAAVLRFRSDLEDRVALDAGAFPPPRPRAGGEPLPALAGAGTAEALGLAPGAILALRPPGASAAPPVAVEIAGVARALGADGGGEGWLDRDGEAFALLVPEATFFGAAADLLRGASASYESSYAVEPSAVRASGVAALAARVRALARGEGAPSGLRVESGLPRALAGAGETPGLGLGALTLLLGQAAAAGGVLVAALAARLARARRERHEALAMRGAGPSQLAAIEAFAALSAALAALALGPPLAAAAVAALGRLAAFGAYSGGGWLRFDPGADALPYAAAAGLAAFALAWTPAAFAARRAAAPPAARRPPSVSPLAAAAALALAAAAGAWALTRGERLFAADGETRHALLLAPAAALLPAALAGSWALPRLAEPLARLAALGRSAAAFAALRGLARRPGGLAFALAAAAGAAALLLATLPPALDRSPGERAAHAAGADLRAAGLRALDGRGEAAFRAAIAEIPAGAASPVARADASLRGEDGEAVAIELLGVDPATFGGVAAWRGDHAPQPLASILETLATNAAASPGGAALPEGARQVGAWVRLPALGGEASLAVALRDDEGRAHDLLLGRLRPGALAGWGFLAADLAAPIGLGGEPLDPAALSGPLTAEAVYARLGAEAAGAAGSIVFGPLLASLDAPSAPLDGVSRLLPRSAEFGRRAVVHDFAALDGIEPIAGLAGGGEAQSARATIDAPPGYEGSLRLDWEAAEAGAAAPRARGFRRATDGAPVLLFASREALARLGAAPGDELALEVAGRSLRAQAAGTLDRFPALGADGGPFAVAHLGRLLDAVNASPGGERLRSSEAWFAASDPAATARALGAGGLEAAFVADREAGAAALAAARAFALGWRGALVLALAALLALAAIAIAAEAAGTAREGRRAGAIAEALGGSAARETAAALAAALARLAAGATLGLAAGAALARWLLGALAAAPDGAALAPPPRAEAAADGPLLLALGALLAAFAAAAVLAALRRREPWTRRAAALAREARG